MNPFKVKINLNYPGLLIYPTARMTASLEMFYLTADKIALAAGSLCHEAGSTNFRSLNCSS